MRGNYLVLWANQIPPFISSRFCGITQPAQAVTFTESGKCVKQKKGCSKLSSSRLAFGFALVDFSQNNPMSPGDGPVFLSLTWAPFTRVLPVPSVSRVVAMVRTKMRFLSSPEVVLSQWCFAVRVARRSLVLLTLHRWDPRAARPCLCCVQLGRAALHHSSAPRLSGPGVVPTTVSSLCSDCTHQLLQQGHKPEQSWFAWVLLPMASLPHPVQPPLGRGLGSSTH